MAEYIEREQAIKIAESYGLKNGSALGRHSGIADCIAEAISIIPSADVAPVRNGRWVIKHKHRGGFHRYTGIDNMGEQHTITVDERVEYDDRYCSECGKQSADNFLTYCHNYGAKMDLEEKDG